MGIPLAVIQSRLGLKADGIFGKQTLLKLTEVLKFSKEYSAHFFGQTSHESAEFNYDTENLNYSANNLLKVFPSYFKTVESTKGYANNPIAIANKVYANRMGNGNEASGDGWKFRGRSSLQLTGKDNYKLFSDYIGEDCVANPDLVASKYFLEAAKFFFDKNKLWQYCKTVDNNSITKVTKLINGGTNGIEDRILKTNKYYTWLNQQ